VKVALVTRSLKAYSSARALAVVLALGVGITWYLWHSRVRACGFNGLKGEPSFPATTAFLVLIPLCPIVTVMRGLSEHRALRDLGRLIVLATVLGAGAIGIAELAFLADRNCFG
jgi:hypothetical protein